ncbi:hypothetical protein F5Y08DRAFT_72147 [Xylaria arbuscula]|nr:hypothetical protein F5Y08DRAFT_72147 [Xylaria arbuscula]
METGFNMEFIDPRLLADESHYTDSSTQFEQAEISFSDFVYDENVDAMAYYSPYADYSVYPEAPLMTDSHFTQPDAQPGFGPGYFIDHQLPMEPMFAPVQALNPRYVSASTQTDSEPTVSRQAASSPAASRSAKPKSPEPSRYSLRQRARSPRAQSAAETVEEVKDERRLRKARQRQALKPPSPSSTLFQAEELTKPLSKHAGEMPGFQAVDLDAYVRRCADTRIVKGRIMRPLNPFMLYRMAYRQVARTLFHSENNQLISTVVGVSWKMESKAVLDCFRTLAEIEKSTHLAMFPDYKYRPANKAEYPVPITPAFTNDSAYKEY